MEKQKDHVDYADGMDILVPHEHRFSALNRDFGSLVGAGLPLFSVGGGILRWTLYQILTDFHVQRGYKVVMTPAVASTELYKVSGHYDFYKENMYIFNIDEHEFAIKPMNCPFHVLILANLLQKYRDSVPLPYKIFELGNVHRYELSGALYGLMRVRGFTQDDAHIFTPSEYIHETVMTTFQEMKDIYTKLFQLPFSEENIYLRLSMGDREKIGTEFIGDPEEWEKAEDALRSVSQEIKDKEGMKYYEEKGEAAFYGPKIDVVMKFGEDEWQVGTIQFDFNLPRRFKLVDLAKEVGAVEGLFMIHRAYLGSIEGFLGVYLEARKGRLPFVLNPIQVAVIAIRTGKEDVDKAIDEMALLLRDLLVGEGIRAVIVPADRPSLSRRVRKMETTIRPSIQIYIGEKDLEKGRTKVKYYVLGEGFKEKEIAFSSAEELFHGTMEIVRELEEDVRDLTGKNYRMYEDLQYMV
jgi:threonyl-tRNA synthetase